MDLTRVMHVGRDHTCRKWARKLGRYVKCIHEGGEERCKDFLFVDRKKYERKIGRRFLRDAGLKLG